MATVPQLMERLLSVDGASYIFGHEVNLDDTAPWAFDCSELIEWACHQIGVSPRMPDGSWYQARHTRNRGLMFPYPSAASIRAAVDIRGALLFRFVGDPFVGGRPRQAHVAVSQGDGLTIEARSATHGVGQFSALNRGWTHAGLIPGLDYTGGGYVDEIDDPTWLEMGKLFPGEDWSYYTSRGDRNGARATYAEKVAAWNKWMRRVSARAPID